MKNDNDILYIFLHIPKCGGTTFVHHIEKNIEPEERLGFYLDPFRHYKGNQPLIKEFLRSLPEEKKGAIRVVYGHHVYYGIHTFFNKEARYITLIRNPEDRLISTYNFYRDQLKSPHRDNFTERVRADITKDGEIVSFEYWLGNRTWHNNYIAKFLEQQRFIENGLAQKSDWIMGEEKQRPESETMSADIMRRALEKFYFIGITENYEEDAHFLHNFLGIDIPYENKNVSKKYFELKGHENPEAIRALIAARNAVDNELYLLARKYNRNFKIRKKERVIVKNISKQFTIGTYEKRGALGRIVASVSGRSSTRRLYALRDVSFTLKEREVLGVVGANGAGKTTLLRIIAGILEQDGGGVETKGNMVALLGLQAAIHPRLTIEENIFLLCTVLGFSGEDIKGKLASIIEFAELADFAGTKWYQLSEGMKQRAMFSAAAHTRPDILVLDELFAVGDERFKRKSARHICELANQGTAIILASHSLSVVQNNCHRVLWLDDGRIRREGPTAEVIKEYAEHERRRTP